MLEQLNVVSGRLPEGVTPKLGPDATGVGWAFMYTLNSEERSLADLRSYQDWYLRYGLTSVDGVAEVAHGQEWIEGYARAARVARGAATLLGAVLTALAHRRRQRKSVKA